MLRELLLPTKVTERKSHLLASLLHLFASVCFSLHLSCNSLEQGILPGGHVQSGVDVNRTEVNYCSSVSKGGNNTMV